MGKKETYRKGENRKDSGRRSPEENGLCRFYATKLSGNPECQSKHVFKLRKNLRETHT